MFEVCESRTLAADLAAALRHRLHAEHRESPFSPLDPRDAVARAANAVRDLGLEPTAWRGGVDLVGVEVDHVWLVVDGWVLDAAFPLFMPDFRALLTGWVAGDVDGDALVQVAAAAEVDHRVVGAVPDGARYVGAPVWSARGRGVG